MTLGDPSVIEFAGDENPGDGINNSATDARHGQKESSTSRATTPRLFRPWPERKPHKATFAILPVRGRSGFLSIIDRFPRGSLNLSERWPG